jgi:gas vesicle protein
MDDEQGPGDASFVLGLILGMAIGAGLVLILSPRLGQQAREAIRERGLVLRDRMQETADSVQATAAPTRDAVVSRIQAPASSSPPA